MKKFPSSSPQNLSTEGEGLNRLFTALGKLSAALLFACDALTEFS